MMDSLDKLLVSWLPMIILIVVWLFLMRRYYGKRGTNYMAMTLEHLRNLENIMERIAVAVERLADKRR